MGWLILGSDGTQVVLKPRLLAGKVQQDQLGYLDGVREHGNSKGLGKK